VVERSLAWLVGYRRLQVRYERRSDILLGFLHLACALICLKALNQSAEGLRTRPDSPARSSRAGALRSAARRSAAAS
jgi:hypothetical protein